MTESRGGPRPRSGPHRRRLYFDAETAKLLAEHMQRLNEPSLSEEEAVKRLLLAAQTQREQAQAAVIQAVQEVLRERWPAIIQQLLSTAGLQLEGLSAQIIERIQRLGVSREEI